MKRIRRYQVVVVVDTKALLGPQLRHVIEIKDGYNEEEFKKMYYKNFAKLPGDEFFYCDSPEAFVKIMKEYDPCFSWEGC